MRLATRSSSINTSLLFTSNHETSRRIHDHAHRNRNNPSPLTNCHTRITTTANTNTIIIALIFELGLKHSPQIEPYNHLKYLLHTFPKAAHNTHRIPCVHLLPPLVKHLLSSPKRPRGGSARLLIANQPHNHYIHGLRAVQSSGISGTVALSAAVAADIVDSHERGAYMGLTSLGNILAPSLGPVLGGLITSHCGWRGVFCFLAGGGVVVLLVLGFFLPETRKARVNTLEVGSVERGQAEGAAPDNQQSKRRKKPGLPNPLTPLRLLAHFPTSLVLLSNGLVFASYYAVTAGIPSQFARIYGLSDMEVGLVFLPAGVGSLVSATFNGALVDWNYRRVRKMYEDTKVTAEGDNEVSGAAEGTQSDWEFPVERARLQVGGPMTLFCSLVIFIYGLVLDRHPPLALSLAMIFLVSFSITASYNVMNVLLVDLYYSTPATVMATNNFVRCFLGAVSTALVTPMIERFGGGRTYGMVAALIVGVCCPVLGTVYVNGVQWRVQRESKFR
ncbi:putative MFS efflux transporter [Aspergillus nidulans FGSC A4]|uniref:Major facilitator superfamily (MFS) profile domain-containing protein n=1 Tax=Emericella nidulans (strain FGSC A4 / ATCC 38163 / CBS 112.46 / NRRL 194 / M139) TaxID=227321 RepID=C8VBT6_EMENI|nr:hypothetical protein [Aspergillus nidulans FGSC A4]CBF79702.1 TPA: conserved hypothetical protein [Aspergillus nidulans FGSC A4]